MKRRKFQFSLRCALVVLTAAAILAFWFRPSRVEVGFTIEGFTNELEQPSRKPYVGANIRVTNRAWNSLWYRAYNPEHPNSDTYQRIKDEWHYRGFYTEPAKWVKLERGGSFVFVIPLDDEAKALKVGLRFATRRGGEEVGAWSDEFTVHRPPPPQGSGSQGSRGLSLHKGNPEP